MKKVCSWIRGRFFFGVYEGKRERKVDLKRKGGKGSEGMGWERKERKEKKRNLRPNIDSRRRILLGMARVQNLAIIRII